MSLKNYIDANTLANDIRLERQASSVTFLLVEGNTDKKLFTKFVNPKKCSIIVTLGRENTIGAIARLDESGFKGALALADKDFDDFGDQVFWSSNLIYTEYHDVECMMVKSSAFDKVLLERGRLDQIEEFESRHGKPLREILLEKGSFVGCARLISLREHLNLRFSDLQFKFVDSTTLDLDCSKLVDQVISRTSGCSVTRANLHRSIQDELGCNHDLWQLCVGHDIVAILSIGLRRVLGNAPAQEVEESLLESQLRLAFSYADFQGSKLFAAILAWTRRNNPHQVF